MGKMDLRIRPIKVKLLLAIFLAFVLSLSFLKIKGQVEPSSTEFNGTFDARYFFDMELFMKGESDKKMFPIKGRVLGAIVPHHILASYLMSSLFDSLPGDYDTVFILGPNHKEEGEALAYTSKAAWQTEFGTVKASSRRIDSLSGEVVKIDDGIISEEHSVAVPINYIKKYLPEAEVVPLVLNEAYSVKDISGLSKLLLPFMNERTLVLASVDFSHYLTASEAEKMDKLTLKAIAEGDYTKLNEFNSDNLDSSSSMILIDMLMKEKGSGNLQVLENSNSYALTNYNKDVTSYIVGVYSSR
jgi:AmmeMemoRadiSam system protein B